ncbi:MAG: choice-of-anchor J domain-containing protein [Candidatus Electrothrix sp. Rat3]|nr:choice-of-anchor J domain-containing protein [Candidatus Electrothrix rattekaaiensis]
MDPYRNKVLVGVALFLLFISSENLFATTGVLLEDFNSCQIPVDWEVMDLLEHEGGSCGWQWRLNEGLEVNKTGGGDEGCFILANSDECGLGTNIDTVLVTPSLDCLDLTGISLSFKYDAFEGQGTSTFAVEISTDGGSNWVPVWQQAQSDRGPKTASVDISSEADGQPSVLIRFRYNASWDWWWQIDDVTVISNEKKSFNWLLFLPAITAGSDPTV